MTGLSKLLSFTFFPKHFDIETNMWSGVMFKEQENISFLIAHLVLGPEGYCIITRQNYPGDYCIIITKV